MKTLAQMMDEVQHKIVTLRVIKQAKHGENFDELLMANTFMSFDVDGEQMQDSIRPDLIYLTDNSSSHGIYVSKSTLDKYILSKHEFETMYIFNYFV